MFVRKPTKVGLLIEEDLRDLEEVKRQASDLWNGCMKPSAASEIFASLNCIKLKRRTKPEIDIESAISFPSGNGLNIRLQSIHSLRDMGQERQSAEIVGSPPGESESSVRRHTGTGR